jgi:hypothetical protein
MKPDSAEDASQELVAVRTFLSESEAEIAKGALTAFGIESLLSHDDCGGQRTHLNMVRGIRLMVRSADLAEAEEALTAGMEDE